MVTSYARLIALIINVQQCFQGCFSVGNLCLVFVEALVRTHYSGFQVRLNIACCMYGKFMVCTAHRLQR